MLRPILAVLALAAVVLLARPPAARAADPQALVEAGRRATVYVVVEAGGVRGSGTGFCVDSSGLFVTNDHVVTLKGKAPKGGPVNVTVVAAPGTKAERKLPATVVRTDPRLDLALLRVEKPGT
ncbi:MAG TPA: serine protease, partial [Humisphaera sp.]